MIDENDIMNRKPLLNVYLPKKDDLKGDFLATLQDFLRMPIHVHEGHAPAICEVNFDLSPPVKLAIHLSLLDALPPEAKDYRGN